MTIAHDEHERPRQGGGLERVLLIAAILVLAGTLRFTGLNWDLAQWIHPDEGHMRMVTGAIRLPDRLGDYFNTAASPLNPRNNGQTYSYGTLPLFATRALAEWLEQGCARPGMAAPPAIQAWAARWMLARAGERVETSVSGAPLCGSGTFTWTYSAFLGRHLAALADLGTVLLLYLLGRRLYGERVGLIAMALGAVTAFMIQQAHFFTVDSAATFFTMLTATCAVMAGQRARVPWFELALGGVATGLATACKISAVFAAGLVALGGVWWALRRSGTSPAGTTAPLRDPLPEPLPAEAPQIPAAGHEPTAHPHRPLRADPRHALRAHLRRLLDAAARVLPALVLSGLVAFAAFRVAQPYAFEGPGFLNVLPDEAWFERLRQIGEEQSGSVDYPSGRQWTRRWPIVFPWVNMVVWGMGLPLGLAAWAGWAVAGYELVRGRGTRHLVLWTWTALTFLYYATRWVKAMRYFLPVYPLLILFGAYALVRLVEHWSGRRPAAEPRGPGEPIPATIEEVGEPVGTVDQTAGICTEAAAPGATDRPAPESGGPGQPAQTGVEDVREPAVGELAEVRQPAEVREPVVREPTETGDQAAGPNHRRSWPYALALALLASVVAATAAWGAAFFGISLRPHTRVAASRWIYAHVPPGSVLANEHWDWGLPLRIDGRDGFAAGDPAGYLGMEMALYDEDTPEKRLRLLTWLEHADTLIMASNRLYGSIPRLPERYPLTTTYYRALFSGELGFELAARFTSYPQLGPFVFPDQEIPYPLMPAGTATQDHLIPVPLPPAEESFSVYDHPDCLIFRKTAAYSPERAAALLSAVDLDAARIGLTPQAATPAAVRIGHDAALVVGLVLVALVVGSAALRPAPVPKGT